MNEANLLSEVVRFDIDKEVSPDGLYLAYCSFGLMIEMAKMAAYHNKLLTRYLVSGSRCAAITTNFL